MHIRELLTAEQLEEHIEQVNAPRVHEAWTLASYDLVLTTREHVVPRTQVIRPITCLRDRAYFAGHLDGRSGVRGLNLMLDDINELRAIQEPLTEAMVNKQIHILRNELYPNDRENITSLLRNEVRFQAVPEKIKNLQCARIEFPMEYATFLQVPLIDSLSLSLARACKSSPRCCPFPAGTLRVGGGPSGRPRAHGGVLLERRVRDARAVGRRAAQWLGRAREAARQGRKKKAANGEPEGLHDHHDAQRPGRQALLEQEEVAAQVT